MNKINYVEDIEAYLQETSEKISALNGVCSKALSGLDNSIDNLDINTFYYQTLKDHKHVHLIMLPLINDIKEDISDSLSIIEDIKRLYPAGKQRVEQR